VGSTVPGEALAAASTIGEWAVVAVLVTAGVWLVLKREAWARDVYALRPLGRGGVVITATIGVMAVIAAIWWAIAGDS